MPFALGARILARFGGGDQVIPHEPNLLSPFIVATNICVAMSVNPFALGVPRHHRRLGTIAACYSDSSYAIDYDDGSRLPAAY